MKILHICLAAFYIDDYSYQENILPKFHKKMGHEVKILASPDIFNLNGKLIVPKQLEVKRYINSNDIEVIRIPYKKYTKFGKKLKKFTDITFFLDEYQPNLIFIHGVQFTNLNEIIEYKKNNPDTIIKIDNHADFSNSATNWVSKNILHKIIWKHQALKIEPFTTDFYGVLPARVDFLKNVYKLPEEKISLLIMGGDNDLIKKVHSDQLNKKTVYGENIQEDDFVIVTLGKINVAKKEVLELMKAVKELSLDVKLFIYGSVSLDLQDSFNQMIDDKQIFYKGWVNNEEAYKVMLQSDLLVFPGRHSVYWEVGASLGRPMMVKKWAGTQHVNIDGNVIFLENADKAEMIVKLKKIIDKNTIYQKLEKQAKEVACEFEYSKIAEKSLE